MSKKRSYTTIDAAVQRQIYYDYTQTGESLSYGTLSAKYHIGRSTIHRIITRGNQHNGDPVTPRGHKKRKLSPGEELRIQNAVLGNPTITNKELAKKVNNKITRQSVSNVLARADPPTTRRRLYDQEPEELTDDWKDGCRRFINFVTHNIPLNTRIYEDETAIYANEAPKFGRGPRGKVLYRGKARYAKKYTLYVFAKRDGILFWQLTDKNAKEPWFEQIALKAVKKMKNGETLLWNRLGRSGRKLDPDKLHYNKKVVKAIDDSGVKLRYLPRYGKYFNPLEMLFSDLKLHYVEPLANSDGKTTPFKQLQKAIKYYMDNKAKTVLPGFFAARANGKQAMKDGLLD
jgi:transposase